LPSSIRQIAARNAAIEREPEDLGFIVGLVMADTG
jgi:hypothetical protein